MQTNLYEVENLILKFNLINETTVTIEAMDQYYFYNKMASFNFLYNEGWYYTINNKKVEVKRFSTIMNYLFKINNNLLYSTKEVDQAKENVKRIKQAENKAYKAELKESDNNKAIQFIERLQSHKTDDKTINVIINKSIEKLETIVNNSFKNASKKVLTSVYNVIVEYKNSLHEEHTCKERPRKLINYKEFYAEQLAMVQSEMNDIEIASIESINNEMTYTVEEMDFATVDNYIIQYKGTDYNKAVEVFKLLHVNGIDAQMYNNKDVILFENYNSVDNIIRCDYLFLHDTHTVKQVTHTDIYNNNYTLTPITNNKTNDRVKQKLELTNDIMYRPSVSHLYKADMLYFNCNTESKYNHQYYKKQLEMYKLTNKYDSESIDNEVLTKIINESVCWISIISTDCYHDDNKILINIDFSTINHPISCYIDNEFYNEYLKSHINRLKKTS